MKTQYKMRTKIVVIITLILSLSLTAQIDRSKQPEPGPAPKITLENPIEFELKNGMKVLVVENHKLPRVSYSLRIDNTPISEGNIAGVSNILGAMLGNGTTTIPKDDFNEEIDFMGARLNFGSQNAFASGLSKYSDRILELMADATLNPLLTEEELEKEKAKLIDGLKSQEKDVSAISSRVTLALAYGKNHPFGEFVTEASCNNITLNNVRESYKKNFNPRKAYLVVVGDVDSENIKKLVKNYFGKWVNNSDPSADFPDAQPNVKQTEIDFVDMPNAVQSNISLTNTVNLQMNNPDYHAVLLANQILGGGFESYLFNNLREVHGYTYGSYSGINTNKYTVSRFRAVADVRNTVTDSSVVEMLKEVNRIRTEDVDSTELTNTKAKYVGNFVLALENPEIIAEYALNIKVNNLPEDFYETYLEKINAVTIEDIKRVANAYFKSDNARIVVVGKGSDVIENLEKTGIPIKYFDKFANPIEKPEFTKPIPDGITAQTVIDNYINAIGGKEKALAIKTLNSDADVTIEGAPFSPKANIKQMLPNKESLEMSIEGMGVIMKQKFDGSAGYVEQQGQRMALEGDMLEAQKSKTTILPELYYNDATQLSLESLTAIEGVDVYKVKVDKNGKASIKYFDTETGLLLREEQTLVTAGAETTTVVDYSEYVEVEGVKFPHHQIIKSGPQTIIFNISSIIVNEGVSDADFE